ncbi:hypothetical protein P8452_66169 [Trifolium repens]|nr:hypothetical protein P8452_66169 [Trifolium repens]
MNPIDIITMREVLSYEPKATFHVVHYKNQLYTEVDPAFVLQYWRNLHTWWHILDYNAIPPKKLQYNKDFDHPLIIGG